MNTLLRLLLVVLLLTPCLGFAQAFKLEQDTSQFRDELEKIEKQLDMRGEAALQEDQVSDFKKRLANIRSQAKQCTLDSTANLQTLKARHDALGEAAAGEADSVAKLRKELDANINNAEKLRVACELLAQKSAAQIEKIELQDQAALKASLMNHDTSAFASVSDMLEHPLGWSRLVSGFLDKGSGWELLNLFQKWSVVLLSGLFFVAGIFLQKRYRAYGEANINFAHLIKALPWFLATLGPTLLLLAYIPTWPPALTTMLVAAIMLWVVIDAAICIWVAGKCKAGLLEEDAKSLCRWLRILFTILILSGLLLTSEAVIQLPDPHYILLRAALAWVLAVGVSFLAVLLGRVPGLVGTSFIRVFLVLSAIFIAITETAGFRNLAVYLFLGIGGTVLGYAAAHFIYCIFLSAFDGLDEGRYQWQKAFRDWLQLKSKEPVPGLIWLRLFTILATWSGFVVWTLWVWQQSDLLFSNIIQYALDGFNVGSLHFSPVQLLGGIIILAVGISLTQWIKRRFVTEIVKRSRLDRGGREAVVSVSGYVGITISLLIALGVAGIDFSNLAIIAGALSVGIGFGLQNVVNNFVSGLILLFERPVRTGDWIVVGDTQGFVRKISIRSTQIETFDRLDVIVPNSELVSNKVANWMLNDPWGRITIPVGVAYGSDVSKVLQILTDIANNHEAVLKDKTSIPAPKALFRRFGDSALEFELRCFIRQIDKIIDITSEMNIAIDQAFREAGISIPFPQRDLHVKSLPDNYGGHDKK